MSLRLQPVSVGAGSPDIESQLVFADSFLVAVLVQLSAVHGEQSGMWFLEAGFGCLNHRQPPVFADLDEAQAWITDQLASAA